MDKDQAVIRIGGVVIGARIHDGGQGTVHHRADARIIKHAVTPTERMVADLQFSDRPRRPDADVAAEVALAVNRKRVAAETGEDGLGVGVAVVNADPVVEATRGIRAVKKLEIIIGGFGCYLHATHVRSFEVDVPAGSGNVSRHVKFDTRRRRADAEIVPGIGPVGI